VPVTRAADQAIFAVVAGTLVVVAVMFRAILLVRILEVYLPIHPQGRRVWVAGAGNLPRVRFVSVVPEAAQRDLKGAHLS
jgi:hypothetical protein